MAKKKKKKSNRIYTAVVSILGIAILVLAVSLLFRIQTIRVEGSHYCTDRQIREMVQSDRYSVNSLYILGKYYLGKGECLPCLESVKISLKSPWEIKVTVKEKPMVGYLADGGECLCFDKEGLIVYKDSEPPEGLPRVNGIAVKDPGLYKPVKSGDPGIFEEILKTTQELKKYDLEIKKILCKNGNIYLYINKTCVSLGSTVSAEQIAQIQPIMEKIGNKKGTLHLENYSENQEIITFQKGEFLKEK